MARFNVTFESSGYTQDKSILDATCSEQEAQGFNETDKAEGDFPAGIIAVVKGYITPDDGQGDSDIRVFASVTLLIEADSEAKAEAMDPPEDLLTKVADMMGKDFTGHCVLELEEHAWEVVEVETATPAQKSARSPSRGM